MEEMFFPGRAKKGEKGRRLKRAGKLLLLFAFQEIQQE